MPRKDVCQGNMDEMVLSGSKSWITSFSHQCWNRVQEKKVDKRYEETEKGWKWGKERHVHTQACE